MDNGLSYVGCYLGSEVCMRTLIFEERLVARVI